MIQRLIVSALVGWALFISGMISCSSLPPASGSGTVPAAGSPSAAPSSGGGSSSAPNSPSGTSAGGSGSSSTGSSIPATGGSFMPPVNTRTVVQVTDNAEDDHWGANNTWTTTARRRVLWQHETLGGDVEIFLGDDAGGNNLVKTLPAFPDVDFMALGSGAGSGDVLAAWREDLMTTFVSDGTATTGLGDRNQEENSIADGCFFYRDSTNGPVNNEIARYDAVGGNVLVSQAGLSDSEPVTSGCDAVWLRNGELVYFDGATIAPIAAGPFTGFDFRDGQVVYSMGGDVFLYDTTASAPAPVNLTNAPADLNHFPKTDGRSVVFTRAIGAIHDVVLYDIASGTSQTISTTTAAKEGSSLAIDLQQVIWMEGGDLYFFDGAATDFVDPFPASAVNEAHLRDGLVVWHGPTGPGTDEEIFLMK